MKIAVLLTTFNRKSKTLACLNSLKAQTLSDNIVIEVFLTDDASKDGTAEAVKQVYPDAHIFNGNGSLFWAGGMRNSWKQALVHNFDYYLLLNDDTLLNNNALSTLLEISNAEFAENNKNAIIIGSTVDVSTGDISYGGRKLSSKFRLKSYKVYSQTNIMDCDLGNANIMLVPRQIVNQIGILSEDFTHGIADYDYTLRARKEGFKVIVAPGILGSCVDDTKKNWKSSQTSLKERITYLKSPKGLAYKEYLQFIKNHFPYDYPSTFCKLWMKTFFPFVWEAFKK
jgi:GT2 family glycosyltransferase